MSSITADRRRSVVRVWRIGLVVCLFVATSVGQRISILTPSESDLSVEFASTLSQRLARRKFRVDDGDLSRSAAASVEIENIFNMSVSDARWLGSVLGSQFYILIKTGNLRRTSSQVEMYYEAFAAIYLVNSASGRLVKWELVSINEPTSAKAAKQLIAAADRVAQTVSDAVKIEMMKTSDLGNQVVFPPVPDAKTQGFDGLRPPMPYRRIAPQYTATANLYGIEATVEIEVNVDDEGKIASTEIVRWAGYGLDESVDETARKMNWRPATIGAKSLPMRVLLRYNFKRIEKDDDN